MFPGCGPSAVKEPPAYHIGSMDRGDVVVVPVVNPDGRVLAELGYLQRKNTDGSYGGGCGVPNIGVDLNRNNDFKWGTVNKPSESKCSETYPGPLQASEPETTAVRDLIRSLFPDPTWFSGHGDTPRTRRPIPRTSRRSATSSPPTTASRRGSRSASIRPPARARRHGSGARHGDRGPHHSPLLQRRARHRVLHVRDARYDEASNGGRSIVANATSEVATALFGPFIERHLVFVRAQDSNGNWGPVRGVFTPDPACASTDGTFPSGAPGLVIHSAGGATAVHKADSFQVTFP